MKDPKICVRYIGCKAFINGNRLLDFSFSRSDGSFQRISMRAVSALFSGPNGMTIQECPGICYETLKGYAIGSPETLPRSIKLTPADVAQHRRHGRGSGSHHRIAYR